MKFKRDMALKDWKKREIERIGLEFSKNRKKILITFKKTYTQVEIFVDGHYEENEVLHSKTQAIAYAKRYMRNN